MILRILQDRIAEIVLEENERPDPMEIARLMLDHSTYSAKIIRIQTAKESRLADAV